MSSVPSQGVVIQEATTAKKRGSSGTVGKGTSGSRLKSRWRSSKTQLSLKVWAREIKKGINEDSKDASAWFLNKGAGTSEQRKARALRIKERKSANRTAKLGRKSKGKQKQQPKKAA